MGTRNSTMVISKDEVKIAQYGQWDGHPGGQGNTILKHLNNIIDSGKIDEFRKKVDNLSDYTKEELDKIDEIDNWMSIYPELSRDTGSEIIKMVMDGCSKVSLYPEFVYDSVFCEWAYVVDLDKMVLEIYKGFNSDPLYKDKDRFYQDGGNEKEYKPVKINAVFDLLDLPKFFYEENDTQTIYAEMSNGQKFDIESTIKSRNRSNRIKSIEEEN